MRKFVQGFECNSATTHIQATEGPWGILYSNVSTLVSDRCGLSGLLYHSAHETHSLLALILGMIQIINKTTDVNNAIGIIPSWEQRFAGHVQKTFVAQLQHSWHGQKTQTLYLGFLISENLSKQPNIAAAVKTSPLLEITVEKWH